jgi:hypothetical protein
LFRKDTLPPSSGYQIMGRCKSPKMAPISGPPHAPVGLPRSVQSCFGTRCGGFDHTRDLTSEPGGTDNVVNEVYVALGPQSRQGPTALLPQSVRAVAQLAEAQAGRSRVRDPMRSLNI